MPKSKKDAIKSRVKKKKGRPKQAANTASVKVPLKYLGQDPMVEFHRPPRRGVQSAVPPDDEAARHQYPPPSNNPLFREKWMLFINNVTSRDNFHVGHLETLKVFCELLVEYAEIKEFLEENGRSYCSIGRSGEVWRLYPEVQHLKKVESSIKDYSKLMDLVLKKDHGSESGGEGDKWE